MRNDEQAPASREDVAYIADDVMIAAVFSR
jgi:hypothetical protein